MKRLIYLLLPLFLAACTADDPTPAEVHPATCLEIPLSVMVRNDASTRIGDPGVTDELLPPSNLYLFVMKKHKAPSAGETYEFLFLRKTGIAANQWGVQDKGHHYDERYQLRLTVTQLSEPLQNMYPEGESLGRAYAIATTKAIDDDKLTAIIKSLCGLAEGVTVTLTDDEYVNKEVSKSAFTDFDTKVGAIELNCSDWTSADFCDLYSSPTADDGRVDVTGLHNGEIVYSPLKNADTYVVFGDVRVYHAAAKIDYKWEVPADLQDEIAVSKITTTGLPTTCRIFRPTANDEGTKTHIITTNPGNKWIGREYFHALQPPTGKISYTVDFQAVNGGTAKGSVSTSFAPGNVHNVFTGWFRINAMIKN